MSKFSFPKQEAEEVKVDPAALEAFAAGAKERQGQRPWAQHDPQAPPRHNISVRLNDHHLEMLRYIAEALDTSQHKLLRKHLVPVIERLAEEMYTERVDK
jgi:hypothetical protein